ncbi:hypothetical protein SETIT_3G007500v2 [Setaria italica]|uniref:Uncharacterized protein n=2 Tax=Setaria TaxID=4554 RepID=A0A368Q9Y8_SETIT|nr:hypothetical protein SETIT_3G007500v2 [Setaria italica]TKW23771.1 hypothetical protein SEVIR_3G008700v2 [Setaria viridis]
MRSQPCMIPNLSDAEDGNDGDYVLFMSGASTGSMGWDAGLCGHAAWHGPVGWPRNPRRFASPYDLGERFQFWPAIVFQSLIDLQHLTTATLAAPAQVSLLTTTSLVSCVPLMLVGNMPRAPRNSGPALSMPRNNTNILFSSLASASILRLCKRDLPASKCAWCSFLLTVCLSVDACHPTAVLSPFDLFFY